MATYVWLVRQRPLTEEDNSALHKIFVDDLAWTQPDPIEDGVFYFENGMLSEERSGFISKHPVRQTEAALLKVKNQELANYTRAVCYPFRILEDRP